MEAAVSEAQLACRGSVLCGHYSKEEPYTHARTTPTLSLGMTSVLAIGEKPNSKHPFSISLPPSILARKHILKSARPAGLWWLSLGKASVGTDSSLLFPGITAISGRGLPYWEELLSSVTALVHTSFNASNSFTVTYICDYLTMLPAEVGLLSSLLYF